MKNKPLIITAVVIIALILAWYLITPRIGENYFQDSLAAYSEAQSKQDNTKYQVALELAEKSFKFKAPDTTANLYYAELLARVGRTNEAKTILAEVKRDDASAAQAVDQIVKDLKLQ